MDLFSNCKPHICYPHPGTHRFRVLKIVRPPAYAFRLPRVFAKLETIESNYYNTGDIVLWPLLSETASEFSVCEGYTVDCVAGIKRSRQGRTFVAAQWAFIPVDPPDTVAAATAHAPTATITSEPPCTCTEQQYQTGLATGRGFATTCQYHTHWAKQRKAW